ncbi:hypothetical protein [Algoriphagus mannitolivorans]|uniref:hypothetical protein n=1 Tax=Algoriphagus mannitolivorans TaxID=226504 RepID=UPI00047AAE65|nr:hypothetical protein [Algoriphagus mannitolivorans]
MKTRSLFLLIGLLILSFQANSQSTASWEVPMIEVKYQAPRGETTFLKVDSGFRYADLAFDNRSFRLFYQHNRQSIKNIRMVDQNSKLQIARGRGGSFFGNSRVVFVDGTEVKLKRKNFANGYEITGPYGPLFLVENHAITPTKTYQESDFLTQAMFIFGRIQSTQKPPSDIIYFYNTATINP